jgi:hypothetical protein
MLANGVRSGTKGFAITGAEGPGTIPLSGPGTRMMWHASKGAFRAGGVLYDQWDDANIGHHSTALGWNTVASGSFSVAMGIAAIASGQRSVALGQGRATGQSAFAAVDGWASGARSVAIGEFVTASGEYSTAIGRSASTNGKLGAFVFGDASSGATSVNALTDNHFVVRAGRFWFGNNSDVTATVGRYIETSTGAFLSSGGTWTNSSDSTKKTEFQEIDGDSVLAKLASMPVRTWRYRAEDSTVRHMGPTAQEFRAAFSLGDSDKAIATVDADGVSLAASQALVKRTDRLTRENDALRQANGQLRSELRALEERTALIEGQLARLAALGSSTAVRR